MLFTGEMVRALLSGRKTQTRRIMKPQPSPGFLPEVGLYHRTEVDKRSGIEHPSKDLYYGVADENEDYPCPYGQPGDRIWVRETFLMEVGAPIYRADYEELVAVGLGAVHGGWKPSIFCTRAASRITLEITRVRVERLQDITELDALAEGVTIRTDAKIASRVGSVGPATLEYWHLWEKINGKGSWDKDPWVWVIEFKKL